MGTPHKQLRSAKGWRLSAGAFCVHPGVRDAPFHHGPVIRPQIFNSYDSGIFPSGKQSLLYLWRLFKTRNF